MACSVYGLSCICDIPEYEGFGWGDRTFSARGTHNATGDFVPILVDDKEQIVHFAHLWKPTRVVGNVQPWNDFPTIGFNVPAFSRRAVDALRDLLEPNGEILPLVSDVGEYYAYNVTTIADVLDVERSDITWGLDYKYASWISRHEFHADRLEGLSIFRLQQKTTFYYVTDVFVDRIREHRLNGFDVEKLWPLPPGESWWENWKRRQAARQRKATAIRRQRGGMVATEPPLDPLE